MSTSKRLELDVDGEKVTVDFVKKVGQFPQGYSMGGDYDRVKRRIRINSTQTRGGQRAALMHELIHHAFVKSGITIGRKTEELVADGLDAWLALMLHRNPELVDFLTEED